MLKINEKKHHWIRVLKYNLYNNCHIIKSSLVCETFLKLSEDKYLVKRSTITNPT